MSHDENTPVFTAPITQAILLIRGKKVLLDADLAALYDHYTVENSECTQHDTCIQVM
jgi:hypothetical protein